MSNPFDNLDPDAFELSEEAEAAALKRSASFIDEQEVIVPSNKCESGACEI